MWFEDLMGFPESNPDQVRALLTVDGQQLTSRVNGRSLRCGRLTTPSLAELREQVASVARSGRLRLREVVGDVQQLHIDPRSEGCLIQAASQFNLLEMASPSLTPEAGVGIYEHDPTQGPACAVACGAGTIYRNYFVRVGDQTGQSSNRQLDCLADIGEALGNQDGRFWTMKNGYALLTTAGTELSRSLSELPEASLDDLRGRLRIGVHRDVEVTLNDAGHCLTQVYGSALAVAYGAGRPDAWAPLARVVLEASYEATLCEALLNAGRTGNPLVYLTLLGGGAFGNPDPWIFGALARATYLFRDAELDVAIVSHRQSRPNVRAFVDRWQAGWGSR